MKNFSVKMVPLVILLMGLTGCNWGDNHTQSNTPSGSDTGDTFPPVTEGEESNGSEIDFPEEALAIRPEPAEERRSEGSIGNNETYYLSVIAEEEIGCIKRKVDVRGSFFKNQSENWSLGTISKWDSKTTRIVVMITEDTTMCGGMLILSERIVTDNAFSFDVNGQSITFYMEIPVYNAYTDKTYDVTVSVDGSQAAQGELLGGHINTSKNTEWGNEFDSISNSRGEGINIVLDGGIYIDNIAIIGSIFAKVSKYTSSYDNNGVKEEDPFNPCCAGSGKG